MAQILTQTTQIVCLRLRRRAPTKKTLRNPRSVCAFCVKIIRGIREISG